MGIIIIKCKDGRRYRTECAEVFVDGIHIYSAEKWQVFPETGKVLESVKQVNNVFISWNEIEKIVGGEGDRGD